MTVKRDKIVEYLNECLKVDEFKDYCNNGLQVQGRGDVSKIVTGVTLSKKLIGEAVKRNAEMIIVHHGIFLNDVPSPIQLKGVVKERIKMLLSNDISLVGYHLPLDAHAEIGNNISLAKLLGVKKCEPLEVGYVGELDAETGLREFVKLVDEKLKVKSFVLPYGKEKIKRIAIVSGGSSPYFEKAFDMGADLLLGGDIREGEVRKMEEAGINYINAGHYNTEKLGIQNLGKLVEEKFRVKAEFVDIPCEI